MTESTAADRARAERIAQGKPPVVTDPAVYERLAVILRGVKPATLITSKDAA